jgi:hypothetical protein
MSITELGSLGEFIGSIAVLATLIYLAYQTRQNGHMLAQSKEAQTASMVQANVAGWDGFFRPILEKPEVARLYRRIKAGERVSEEDYESLEAFLLTFTLRLENLMVQARLNPFTADDPDAHFENLLDLWVNRLMKSPSSQEWWRANRIGFTPEFANRMDNQLVKSLSLEVTTA